MALVSREALLVLFPTNVSFLILILYMAMFVGQGLLVTASRKGSSSYSYNTTTVVLATETLKLILSLFGYLKENSFQSLVDGFIKGKKVLFLYLTPAALYCLYNNLSFVNLSYFDPTTYFMFTQIKLLLTGVIYQIFFKRSLSGKQWFSLILLTAGCMIKGLDSTGKSATTEQSSVFSFGIILILIQVLCSVVAGVYNEFLIKGEGAAIHIMIQNIYMYIDSMLCNIILLAFKGELAAAFTSESLTSVLQTIVIAIIINNALVGIVTSLFLKNLNSVVKAFASAIILCLTALLSFPVLGIPVHFYTVVAVGVIGVAVVIYAQNPLQTVTVINDKKHSEVKKELIKEEA